MMTTGTATPRRKPFLLWVALSATLLLWVGQIVGSGMIERNPGNLVALKLALNDADVPPISAQGNDYMAGLAAYAQGDYTRATELLQSAEATYGTFARHWLALSLEQGGEPAAGRAVLNLAEDAELELYGDILLRQWETAPAADKQEYLAFLQARRPEWILPYADRLLGADQLADATLWAQTALDYADQRSAFVVLGRVAFAQGDSATAETWFAQAYERSQDRQTAYWYGLMLSTGSDPVRGTALLEEAVAATADDYPDLAWMLVMTAIGAIRSGDCSKADAAFDRAEAVDPSQDNQDLVTRVRQEYREQCPY